MVDDTAYVHTHQHQPCGTEMWHREAGYEVVSSPEFCCRVGFYKDIPAISRISLGWTITLLGFVVPTIGKAIIQ